MISDFMLSFVFTLDLNHVFLGVGTVWQRAVLPTSRAASISRF
jgi:hypothetical protein